MSEKEILKLGYVVPIVDHAATRKVSCVVGSLGDELADSLSFASQRALARYKE